MIARRIKKFPALAEAMYLSPYHTERAITSESTLRIRHGGEDPSKCSDSPASYRAKPYEIGWTRRNITRKSAQSEL
jgi:hypothetical protein